MLFLAATDPISLPLLQFGIIALTVVIVTTVIACWWCYHAGIVRGRDASARELDGIATPLHLDSSEWRLVSREQPYRSADQTAVLNLRQDRSRIALRGRGGDVQWAGDGVAVGDQVAVVCVETAHDGRRTSTLLLQADGDEMRGVRITSSKHAGSALVHPVTMTRR